MISFSDFEDANGRVDWPRYRRAKVEAGEQCRKCDSYITTFGISPAGPRLCGDCREFEGESGEVEHSLRIRCPACEYNWDAAEAEDYAVFAEDGSSTCCGSCGHDFHVDCRISYTLTSPALLSHVEEDEDA